MKPHVRRGKKAKASRKDRAEFRARLVSTSTKCLNRPRRFQ